MYDELIRKEDAVNILTERAKDLKGSYGDLGGACSGAAMLINEIPAVQEEEFEWCTTCREYDQEKHCCHRWTKVIRQTVKEIREQYALEHPEIVHCDECRYAEIADPKDEQDGYNCQFHKGSIWFSGCYCSWGEKKDE